MGLSEVEVLADQRHVGDAAGEAASGNGHGDIGRWLVDIAGHPHPVMTGSARRVCLDVAAAKGSLLALKVQFRQVGVVGGSSVRQ